MINNNGKIIRFSYKDYSEGKKISYITVKVENFISRLIHPIPDKYFPMIRWRGIFANRWKKHYLALSSSALGQPFIIGSEIQSTPLWAER